MTETSAAAAATEPSMVTDSDILESEMAELVDEWMAKRERDEQFCQEIRQRVHHWLRLMLPAIDRQIIGDYADDRVVTDRLKVLDKVLVELRDFDDRFQRVVTDLVQMKSKLCLKTLQ